MYKTLLKDWNFLRIIRLVLGIMMLGQSFQIHSWAIGLFGGLFIFQSLTNTGCYGAGGCGVPQRSRPANNEHVEEISYEEVK
jgi:hypothetical protein